MFNMAKKKKTKKAESPVKEKKTFVKKAPKGVKLVSLKNQLLWDGKFVKEGEAFEATHEYANRLLSSSSPSYKRA